MWLVAQSHAALQTAETFMNKSAETSTALDACLVCSSRKSTAKDVLRKCAICLHTWHTSCSRATTGAMRKYIDGDMPDLTNLTVPVIFRGERYSAQNQFL